MAMTEVAYELTDSASYLLASESISWASFAYDKLLESVIDGLTPREVGERWLHIEAQVLDTQLAEHGDFYPYTYSLIDLSQMSNVMEAHRLLATEMRNALRNEQSKETTAVAIAAAADAAACFDSNYDGRITLADTYCDLGSFVEQLQTNISVSPEIANAAQSISTNLNAAVLDTRQKSGIPWWSQSAGWWDFSTQPLSGLSIYLPLSPRHDEVRRRFYSGSHLRYVADTNWDALLTDAWDGAEPPTTTVDCDCAETIKPASLLSTILVEPLQPQIEPSEVVSVNLELRNITIQQGFGAAQLRLNYDATVLDAQSCTNMIPPSSINPPSPIIHECNIDTPGNIYLSIAVEDGIISDTVLSQIGFTAIGSVGEASAIDISLDQMIDAYDNPMTIPPVGALITIGSNNTAHLPGDVDCNDTRNIQDAMGILHHVTGAYGLGAQCPPALNTIYEPACDVSGNGDCEHTDALYIVQCTVQKNNPLCPSGVQSAAFSSSIPNLAIPLSPSPITVGTAQLDSNGLWIVPILAEIDEIPLGATTVELTYDATRLILDSCEVNPSADFDIALCYPHYARGDTKQKRHQA